MQVSQRVLGAVVVSVIVRVDGLRFQAGDGVELLDGRRTQAGQGTEHSPLDFSDFGVLDGVDESVLGLRGVSLQLLGGIFLTLKGVPKKIFK